jgi:hypothetical protein
MRAPDYLILVHAHFRANLRAGQVTCPMLAQFGIALRRPW